jgi:hypothetical protein
VFFLPPFYSYCFEENIMGFSQVMFFILTLSVKTRESFSLFLIKDAVQEEDQERKCVFYFRKNNHIMKF